MFTEMMMSASGGGQPYEYIGQFSTNTGSYSNAEVGKTYMLFSTLYNNTTPFNIIGGDILDTVWSGSENASYGVLVFFKATSATITWSNSGMTTSNISKLFTVG